MTVTVAPREGWPRISTGLAPVKGQPGSFSAPDFDVLYDSPLLVGHQEVLSFEVNGIPHTFEGRDLGKLDRVLFTADLKAMVKAATDLMGDIPYERYAFISIGPGGGGLEHLNSQLITFDAAKMADPVEYRRTLRFIAHEYFHHFNVKRIRPIALGPFDDDRENTTRMLWVSEGFTVYYEDLLLVRNGFTYARNNPVNVVDPFGLMAECVGTQCTDSATVIAADPGAESARRFELELRMMRMRRERELTSFGQGLLGAGTTSSPASGEYAAQGASVGDEFLAGLDIPQWLVDGSAGFGDGVSLGLTSLLRPDNVVDTSSGAYIGSAVAGVALNVTINRIGVTTGAEPFATRSFRLAPWGNRTRHPLGERPHYHRRVHDPRRPGQSLPGQGMKRHRPWEGGW